MSADKPQPRTCTECLLGNHAEHERNWSAKSFCPCTGDCHNLPSPAARMFAAHGRSEPNG